MKLPQGISAWMIKYASASKPGKKVLIGDNLSSHLSAEVIRLCEENDIHFVFLPSNSTHLMQPLDVAFFRPMKQAWRGILERWKKGAGSLSSTIPKDVFPRLLKDLTNKIQERQSCNIISGFRECGLVPLNRAKVISKLPKEQLIVVFYRS